MIRQLWVIAVPLSTISGDEKQALEGEDADQNIYGVTNKRKKHLSPGLPHDEYLSMVFNVLLSILGRIFASCIQ